MRFREKTPKADNPIQAKVRKRFERLSTSDILDWADQAGSGVARCLQDYRNYGASESLHEARTGLEGLLTLVDVLQERQ